MSSREFFIGRLAVSVSVSVSSLFLSHWIFPSSPPSLFSLLSNQAGGFKLIVLDEADAMTTAAQGALRRGEFSLAATYRTFVFLWWMFPQSTLPLFSSLTVLSTSILFFLFSIFLLLAVIEQYTKNVRFCIICNYVNKIIPAIQSRCTRFRFNPLELDQVENRLNHVIESEKWVFGIGISKRCDGIAGQDAFEGYLFQMLTDSFLIARIVYSFFQLYRHSGWKGSSVEIE